MAEAMMRILSRLTYVVAHHDQNLWWELKRQIFEFGYQTYYPRQGEFEFAARRALMNLPEPDQRVLIDAWQKNHPNQDDAVNAEILLSYVPLIIDQVVERARSAAYRTENW